MNCHSTTSPTHSEEKSHSAFKDESRDSKTIRTYKGDQPLHSLPEVLAQFGESPRHRRTLPYKRQFSTVDVRPPQKSNLQKTLISLHEETATDIDVTLCDYCGDDLSKGNIVRAVDGTYHKDCEGHIGRSEAAVKLVKNYTSNGHVLSFAIKVDYVYGTVGHKPEDRKRKKLKRSKKLEELARKVSALRNSGSGFILIHLVGLSPGDSYTGYFDEFVDHLLQNLINDGSLFVDVYTKTWLRDAHVIWRNNDLKEEKGDFTDFLLLYVEGSNHVTTTDFKTKIALDDCIMDPTDLTVSSFIRNKKQFKEKFPQCRSDISNLRENRSVQLKSFLPNLNRDVSPVSALFQTRITEYISAFAKNENGGLYYFGVAEDETAFDGAAYKSKTVRITPIEVTDKEQIARDILQRVHDTILVCDYDGNVYEHPDIVRVEFLPLSANQCVICVLVKPVRGIVFHDKEGPLAFRIGADKRSVVRLTVKEWFHAFTQRRPGDFV